MPDTSWWGWTGVTGLVRGNPSGWDFVGGTVTNNDPVTSFNAGLFGAYSLLKREVTHDVQSRIFNNCNCGPTNCYSNCNCACACVCACDCSACMCK